MGTASLRQRLIIGLTTVILGLVALTAAGLVSPVLSFVALVLLIFALVFASPAIVEGKLRLTREPGRLPPAIALMLGGLCFCIACDYLLATNGSGPIGLFWDFWIGLPFWLVAYLWLFTRMTAVATITAAVGLAALTVFGYWQAARSNSELAGVARLAPWFWGIPAIMGIYMVDVVARRIRRKSRGYAREI